MNVSYSKMFMEDTGINGYFIKIGNWVWSNFYTAGFFQIPVEKYEEIIKPFNVQYYKPLSTRDHESIYYFNTIEDVENAIVALKLIGVD